MNGNFIGNEIVKMVLIKGGCEFHGLINLVLCLRIKQIQVRALATIRHIHGVAHAKPMIS